MFGTRLKHYREIVKMGVSPDGDDVSYYRNHVCGVEMIRKNEVGSVHACCTSCPRALRLLTEIIQDSDRNEIIETLRLTRDTPGNTSFESFEINEPISILKATRMLAYWQTGASPDEMKNLQLKK